MQCVERDQLCDGVPHCFVGSDEVRFESQMVQNSGSSVDRALINCHCVERDQLCEFCDGVSDCLVGSDDVNNYSCVKHSKASANLVSKQQSDPKLCIHLYVFNTITAATIPIGYGQFGAFNECCSPFEVGWRAVQLFLKANCHLSEGCSDGKTAVYLHVMVFECLYCKGTHTITNLNMIL